MPELPDVEIYRRRLEDRALHQRIDTVHVAAPELLNDTSRQGLGRLAHGHRFSLARRHGKCLFAGLDSGSWIMLHFGMSGSLAYLERGEEPPRYCRCLFRFANRASLAYVARRKLGRIATPTSPRAYVDAEALGPDALDMDADAFAASAAKRRGQVKSWLMDQGSIAGIGNVYSDEILFQAGVHPRCAVGELSGKTLGRVHRCMHTVLEQAIDAAADPENMPDSFLIPKRKKGGRCPRCAGEIASVKAAGRTAWFCPNCQPQTCSPD
jgi:formamidopyrimidine-DNA glycosylase